jgi:hypothetical protein
MCMISRVHRVESYVICDRFVELLLVTLSLGACGVLQRLQATYPHTQRAAAVEPIVIRFFSSITSYAVRETGIFCRRGHSVDSLLTSCQSCAVRFDGLHKPRRVPKPYIWQVAVRGSRARARVYFTSNSGQAAAPPPLTKQGVQCPVCSGLSTL